jgi:hypothetical protein
MLIWNLIRKIGRPRRRWENNIQMNFSGSGMKRYGLNRAGSE